MESTPSMKISKLILAMAVFCFSQGAIAQTKDWPALNYFKDANAKLGNPAPDENRIVFMGNSITQAWIELHPEFFEGRPYINRGISGQTTPQMLVRFRADVIALKPKAVVILAGVNDIAGNTGPSTLEMIMNNLISMSELAAANKIKVILSSVLPAYDFPWKPGQFPADKISNLNKMIKEYADQNGLIYLDYYTATVDSRRGLKAELTEDGVHPTIAGYKVMEPLVEAAIEKVLK